MQIDNIENKNILQCGKIDNKTYALDFIINPIGLMVMIIGSIPRWDIF